MKILNDLGEFTSDEMIVSEDQYNDLIKMSAGFYNNGYEMHLPNGFMVVPPEIVKRSILIIEIK